MATWWTKVDGKVQKHDGRKPKLGAMIRIAMACSVVGADRDAMGLYRKDPEKHPDAENLLPAMVEKAWHESEAKALRRKVR